MLRDAAAAHVPFNLCCEIPAIPKECFNRDRKFCKSSKCFDSEAILRWRVAKEGFLFELIEIVNVKVFRTNRHWVIRIFKRSLYGDTLSKKTIFVGIFRKKKIIKTTIY